MEEKLTFGKFITKKRKEQNLTQKELAEKLYVTESAVSKWERGISYPDISLITAICETLKVSEHELITASEDYQQKNIEKQANTYRNMVKGYLWTFNILYGLALITCFICNLAIDHKLSWFFIVLTSILTAFSITSFPIMLKTYKLTKTVCALFISLNILLAVCCIYTGGSWFFVAFTAILLGFSLVFLPHYATLLPLQLRIRNHKALIYFIVNTFLLFLLLFAAYLITDDIGTFFKVACPNVLFNILLPWLIMLVVRYLKLNAFFKTSINCFLVGIYLATVNSVSNVLNFGIKFAYPQINLMQWSENYINGNVTFIVFVSLFFVAILFAISGIIYKIKKET